MNTKEIKIETPKPIPKYIIERIKKADDVYKHLIQGRTRFYAYLTIWKKELVKITVAVKNYYKKFLVKQVAVHKMHSDICYIKDIVFYNMAGYVVGWYEQGGSRGANWFEKKEWGWQEDKLFDPYAPIVNREVVDKLPQYKYSAYKLYNGVDIIQYLRLYEQYPQLEYLMKLGFQRYATSKQILKKVGNDKQFIKWLIQHKEEIMSNSCHIDIIVKAYNKNLPLDKLQYERKLINHYTYDYFFKEIKDNVPAQLKLKLMKYLKSNNINTGLYKDYFDACSYLKLDMEQEKNLIPHDFNRWHDIRIDQYNTKKAIADAKKRKKFYAEFGKIANKYVTLEHAKRSAFICIIAKSPADLIKESEILDHCVGKMNYDKRFVDEESLIFFIRPKEKPDIPFVTVEYSLSRHQILQCRGKNNCKPTDDVLHYVNDIWLPYANRKLKQIAA